MKVEVLNSYAYSLRVMGILRYLQRCKIRNKRDLMKSFVAIRSLPLLRSMHKIQILIFRRDIDKHKMPSKYTIIFLIMF